MRSRGDRPVTLQVAARQPTAKPRAGDHAGNRLYERDGIDYARVELTPWRGADVSVLYGERVDGSRLPLTLVRDQSLSSVDV
jgi:hypothetical protein